MSDDTSSTPSLKHELRTPLNHIIGYCEMLIEESEDTPAPDGEGAKVFVEDLQRIHAAGRRLLGVVNDLFDESIPEAQRLNEELMHHEVRTPLNQIIGYTELLQEDAVSLGNESYRADLEKIHTAAHNLLERVLDNFGTTGFSMAGDEGTTPDVPVALLHKSAASSPRAEDSAKRHAPRQIGSILIADDDATNREMLTRRLQRLGHTVTTAANGREVVEMVRSGSYDLLLLDIIMPEMDGYEVLQYLHVNPPKAAMPIIVLSASDESGEVARCIEMGAEDYLAKPFDPTLLQARIESSLEKKHLRDREVMYLRTIEKEKERSDDLLQVILPANVAAELMSTGEVRPRRVENVAVLFADVVGFTSYCETRAPETIHGELQTLVKEMEVLTVAHGMEKIKTIGDAFLSAAGLLTQFENSALDCIRCGLAMIAKAETLPVMWKLRVGVQVGPVVTGIVGRQRYQFDIWGDTVNAAARMQTEAKPGTLCVSAGTWKLLEAYCYGESQGIREIKGKGPLEVFEVMGVK